MNLVDPSIIPWVRSRELVVSLTTNWSEILPPDQRRVGILFATLSTVDILVWPFPRAGTGDPGLVVPNVDAQLLPLRITFEGYGDVVMRRWFGCVRSGAGVDLSIIETRSRVNVLEAHERVGILGRDAGNFSPEP